MNIGLLIGNSKLRIGKKYFEIVLLVKWQNDQICGPFASLSSFILSERAAFGGLGPCPMFRRWARDDAFSFANLRHPNEPKLA